MDRAELRSWVEDALTRLDRDVAERDETPSGVTVTEIVDSVWGRLPLEIRRATSRAQVQASLTLLTVRRGLGVGRPEEPERRAVEGGGPRHGQPR